MWILKATVPEHPKQLVASRTKKYNINIIGYPISHRIENKELYVTSISYMIGEEKNKKSFLNSLKKDKRLKKIEINGDTIITYYTQHIGMSKLYNPYIFFVSPGIITEKGDNLFELASWNKEHLQELAKVFLSKEYKGKIHSFKQQKIDNIFTLRAIPKLTDKQKRAFELAIQKGYYEFPRKIELKELAKISKKAYTTYKFHLRTAEKKLMPMLFKSYN